MKSKADSQTVQEQNEALGTRGEESADHLAAAEELSDEDLNSVSGGLTTRQFG